MPRFNDEATFAATAGFQYSGTKLDKLNESEYTVIVIGTDTTGSVYGFGDELLKAKKEVIRACGHSPRKNNLVVRSFNFNTSVGIEEDHGFRELQNIDPDTDYQALIIGGMTNLCDAAYNAVGSAVDYAEQMYDADVVVDVNAIVFIITDGADNMSTMTPAAVKREIERGVVGEKLDSLLVVLIKVNASGYGNTLDKFQQDCGIQESLDIADASVSSLAKLSKFISKSISVQSQKLGTGQTANLATITL